MKTITSNGTSLSIIDPANAFFIGRAMIDNDGGGPKQGDPDHQNQLSVPNPDGSFADATQVPFVALPPWMMQKLGPPVLGCLCQVVDLATMTMVDAAILDEAPASGYGEMSEALANLFKIPSSPISGGVDVREFLYRIYAGVGANVGGVQYRPQPL